MEVGRVLGDGSRERVGSVPVTLLTEEFAQGAHVPVGMGATQSTAATGGWLPGWLPWSKPAATAPKAAAHPRPSLGPLLQAHRDAGYLECPLAKLAASKAWACWRSDPARAERLLGWAWHPGEGRWRRGPASGSASTFDAAAFVRAHANSTIAFVGDSVVRQQFVSLACLLWREAGLTQQRYRADPRTVVSARYGLTLSFSTSKFLVAKRAGRLALDEVDGRVQEVGPRPWARH